MTTGALYPEVLASAHTMEIANICCSPAESWFFNSSCPSGSSMVTSKLSVSIWILLTRESFSTRVWKHSVAVAESLSIFSRCKRTLNSFRTSIDITEYLIMRELSSFVFSFSAIVLINCKRLEWRASFWRSKLSIKPCCF